MAETAKQTDAEIAATVARVQEALSQTPEARLTAELDKELRRWRPELADHFEKLLQAWRDEIASMN